MDNAREYINKLRYEFTKDVLNESSLLASPFDQFELWFQQAIKAEVSDANAMVVSSVSDEGFPSSRVVLLRNFDANGFVFYSNYLSRKGQELSGNPKVALHFFWPTLERQISVQGIAQKITSEESDQYFESRPRSSQIGAWCSAQSEVLRSREELDAKILLLEEKYIGKKIPRPAFWGGYRVHPISFEFWQGRASRLHDRFRYTKSPNDYLIERLSP